MDENKKIETKPILDPIEGEKQEQSAKRQSLLADLGELRTEVKSFKVSDLVVPAMSIIVLVLLTVFVYLPMIRSALQSQEERKDVGNRLEKLEKLNSDLDRIEVVQLQEDLAISRSVIPFSLQVSDFLTYVDNLSKEKNLIFKEILAGNIQVRDGEDSRKVDTVVRGVSGPLRYTGTLSNITAFLDGLQNASPFIISASDIDLRKSISGEEWDLSLSITGFYLDQNSLPAINIYSSFTPYRQYTDILDIFEEKSDDLPASRIQDVDLDIE